MNKRIRFYVIYSIYWLIFFIIIRMLFMIYNFHETGGLEPIIWLKIFWHGAVLDISAVGYILLLPSVMIVATTFFRREVFRYFSQIYTLILLLVFSYATVADMVLYGYWGFRFDISALWYLKTPHEALASVSWYEIVWPLILGTLLWFGFFWLYRWILTDLTRNWERSRWYVPLVFCGLIALSIIPIRGGIGLAPNNLGRVYFHSNIFANHAAINLPWNILYSITQRKNLSREYQFMDEAEANRRFSALHPPAGPVKSVLRTTRPNIVLIILESFTAKVVGAVGGLADVTPKFNRLAEEGLLFTNFYASGDRTDKCIVPILSGYPALPRGQIIKMHRKLQSLPNLFRDLKAVKYQTAFYYGGEINFASLNSYLVTGQVEKLVTMDDFPSSTYNTKWGVHDHVMFQRLLTDLRSTPEPFFFTLLTLSSHEPFDVPGQPVFDPSTKDGKFINSIFYTDSCLGEFIHEAKNEKWWSNTLIVLLADHGVRMVGRSPNYAAEKFHIPMLWLGGALTLRGVKIASFAAQNDLPVLLLHQLGMDATTYSFSKDVMASGTRPFAFYTFNDGFGFLTEDLLAIYNNNSQNYIVLESANQAEYFDFGKAYLQILSRDFLRR